MPLKTTVSKDKLLEILRENRSKHRKVFETALEGYQKEALKQLNAHVRRIRKGDLREIFVNVPRPEDHTQDYDQVIRMVEMNVHDAIELDETTFASYVLDRWRWKQQWLASNSAYAAATVQEFYEEEL